MKSFILSGTTINLFLNGKSFIAAADHPNYQKIKEALSSEEEEGLAELFDIGHGLGTALNVEGSTARYEGGVVTWNGQCVHSTLANRIIDMVTQGFPVDPMLRFLENLMLNPSARSVNELYEFLENRGLPITPDGCFLAYKAVQSDWMDKYSGKINNSIGAVVEVPRNSVDDDRANECSFGLHVGAQSYVSGYGSGEDHFLVVKVNPRDCVSVPRDHDATKLRVCRYEVLEEAPEIKQAIPARYEAPVVGDNYDPYRPSGDDDDDEEGVCSCCEELCPVDQEYCDNCADGTCGRL